MSAGLPCGPYAAYMESGCSGMFLYVGLNADLLVMPAAFNASGPLHRRMPR